MITRLQVDNDIFVVISFSDLRSLWKLYKAWEPLILDLEKNLQPNEPRGPVDDKSNEKESGESTENDEITVSFSNFHAFTSQQTLEKSFVSSLNSIHKLGQISLHLAEQQMMNTAKKQDAKVTVRILLSYSDV